MKKLLFMGLVLMSASTFASNEKVMSKKSNLSDATECCGSRKESGTPGKAGYMVHTAYRCASSNTAINAKAAACALADADTTSAQLNAAKKVSLTLTQQ